MAGGIQELETQVAGLRLRALAGGGAGPAVVVLHHSIGSTGWGAFPEALAQRCAVHLPDLPGYGASERPDWARHPRDLALVLGFWLRRLEIGRASLVGLGYGGWLAVELAAMAPERVATLALVGAAGLLPAKGRILDPFLISHVDYARAYFSDPRRYQAVLGQELDEDLLERWEISREMTARVTWKPYMYNRVLPHLLPELRVPTLLVWGDDDRVVPRECGEDYARRLPDARLVVVPDCGHAVDLEQPEALAKLVLEHLEARAEDPTCS